MKFWSDEELWSKDDVLQIAEMLDVDSNLIDVFKNSANFDVLYGQDTEEHGGVFPFYLEKCKEHEMETSLIKFFPNRGIGLEEWRRFDVIKEQLKSIEARRRFINYSDIPSLVMDGYIWTLRPRMPIMFDLKRALASDFTSFEKAY